MFSSPSISCKIRWLESGFIQIVIKCPTLIKYMDVTTSRTKIICPIKLPSTSTTLLAFAMPDYTTITRCWPVKQPSSSHFFRNFCFTKNPLSHLLVHHKGHWVPTVLIKLNWHTLCTHCNTQANSQPTTGTNPAISQDQCQNIWHCKCIHMHQIYQHISVNWHKYCTQHSP